MRINLQAFKENYPVLEKKITIDHTALNAFLYEVYKGEPVRIDEDLDIGCDQAQKIAFKLETLGFKKAQELEEKFEDITNFQGISNAQQSKETCEAIAFVITAMELKQRNNFMNFVSDRELACGAGTLANLQDILQIVTGTAKSIDALVANSKRTAIHNIIMPMYQSQMFEESGFRASVHTFDNHIVDGAMEIHHIVRLGGVLKEYGMPPDGEMDEMSASRNPEPCHDLILQAVDAEINADSIIDDVVNQILLCMPKEPSKDAFELYLQSLRIGSVDDFLVKIDGKLQYRPNLQDRIRDLVTIYFAEELHRSKFQHYAQEINNFLNNDNDEELKALLSELNITYNAEELRTTPVTKRNEYISDLIKAPIREKFQLVIVDADELDEIKERKALVMYGSATGIDISEYDEDEIDWKFIISNRLKIRKSESTPAIDSFLFCLINSTTINDEHFLIHFIKENLNIGEQPALFFALDAMDTSIAEILVQLLTPEFLESCNVFNIHKKYWSILLKLGVDADKLSIDTEFANIIQSRFSKFEDFKFFLEFINSNPLTNKEIYLSVFLTNGIESNMPDIVAEILKYPDGRKSLFIPDTSGDIGLHSAAWNGNLAIITEILKYEEGQKCIAYKNHQNLLPLHYAVCNGKDKALELMLKCKAGLALINSKDGVGRTLLHFAARCNQIEVAKELLKYIDGQDSLVTKSQDGTTPLSLLKLESLKELFQIKFIAQSVNELESLQQEVLDIASTYLTNYIKCTELNSSSFLNNRYTCFFHEEEEIIIQKEATHVFVQMCKFLEQICKQPTILIQ